MHRKLTALLLTACLMAGSTIPVYASGEVMADDEEITLTEDVNSDGEEGVGASASAHTEDASVRGEDHDVTVTHEGNDADEDTGRFSTGVESSAEGEGLIASTSVQDISVTSTQNIQTCGTMSTAMAPDAMSFSSARDVEVVSLDTQLAPEDSDYPTMTTGAVAWAGDPHDDDTAGGMAVAMVNDVNVYATAGAVSGGIAEAYGDQSMAYMSIDGTVNAESPDNANAISAYADNNGYAVAALNSGGNVRGGSYACGVITEAHDGGSAYALADGPVDVSASNIYGSAVGAMSSIDGDESVAMAYAGDLSVKGHSAVGLVAGAQDVSHGQVGTVASGDLEVSGKNALAMDLWSEDTEDVAMFAGVNGDVHSTGSGVFIDTSEGTEVEVLITGTLKADDGPAIVIGQNAAPEDVHIVAWKIESNADSLVQEGARGTALASIDPGPYSDKAKAVEGDIYYILRVDSAQAGNINIVSGAEDYSYLDTDSEGLVDTNIAHAGDKVGIKLDVPEGYELKAAYGDAEHTIELTRGSDGNYYLIVPRGGGVTINMVLSLIESRPEEPDGKDNKDDSSGDNKNEDKNVYTPAFMVTNGMAVASIGGTGQVSMTMADLIAYISQGATSIVINTPAGSFTVPIDMELLALIAGGNTIRFVLNGNALEVYVDGGTVPVKTVSIAS